MANIQNDIILAASCYQGAKKIQLYGHNAAVSNSAETIWTPGATYAQLTTAVAMEAISSSANDAAAGTGARTIEVDLVDGDYVESTVTVTMNGTNAVAITGTYIAVNGIRVITAGSGLTNAGTIDIRTVSGSTVKGRIDTTEQSLGRSSDFIYTIPANCVGVLSPIVVSVSGGGGAITTWLRHYTSAGIISSRGAVAIGLGGVGVQTGLMREINFGRGLRLEEKTLIELRAITSTGAGDLFAMADLYVMNKTYCMWLR